MLLCWVCLDCRSRTVGNAGDDAMARLCSVVSLNPSLVSAGLIVITIITIINNEIEDAKENQCTRTQVK